MKGFSFIAPVAVAYNLCLSFTSIQRKFLALFSLILALVLSYVLDAKEGIIMATSLTGVLEIKTEQPVQGEPIRLRMTITNGYNQEVEIINPEVGVPSPDLDWRASNEAYQIAVLMSFGLIKITLKDANGQLVDSKGLVPWVTPILSKRVLQPHENLALEFDLNELFLLDSAGLYSVWLRYGDDTVYADASIDIEIRPDE